MASCSPGSSRLSILAPWQLFTVFRLIFRLGLRISAVNSARYIKHDGLIEHILRILNGPKLLTREKHLKTMAVRENRYRIGRLSLRG